MSRYLAIIAVPNSEEAAAMRLLVKPDRIVVTHPIAALCGVRAENVIVTFTAESVAGGSEVLRERVQQWIDELELKLVPGGKVIHSTR